MGKDTPWEHFPLKAVRGFKAIVLTALPRYLRKRCCSDPTHSTNSERESFVSELGCGLRELAVSLRNMGMFRGVSVLKTVEDLRPIF
jgi:hypothetical protein